MLSPTPPINRPDLHPGTGYLIGPRVPHGLAAVVEGLTREVLRHHPEDIYVFAAHHFEKLLKLREQYHAEKYNVREFDDDVSREFNLWPNKESDWSLDKEAKVFERRGKVPVDVEESPEDVSTDREKRKVSKQTCTKSSSNAKRASKRSTKDKDATSDPRATKIIPQMSALRSSSKTILTKDIKQELRKNKLNSGEKAKSDSVEKGIRGERRSRTKVSKDKNAEEEVAAMTTTSRTSARRPLKKVRRIETESETETEREIAAKERLGNGYEKSSVKGDNANREAVRTRSRDRRPEATAWPSEHSSERKVSSRALSMDRIRAYVLRKFASTASLEVLRSPTYVEQVQEVIDRAAPIIKEKLEEIRKPRGKRSRSVDFAWNEESFRRSAAKDSKKRGDHDEEDKSEQKSGNGALQRESNDARREDKSEDQSTKRSEMTPNTESVEKRSGRRSAGSGKRSRRRESGEQGDFGVADHVEDDSEHSNKSEHEVGVGRDTLEARLTATQSILESISMSASELNGSRKVDSAGDERGESMASSETADHVNVVSLPIVRPPSSKSCKNAAKNGSDSLTLPPISPEAPKSTKKKDELSLPILPAPNGNHSAKKSQEQDASKDAEEASTMRDITSDMEDIAVLPEDEDGRAAAHTEKYLLHSSAKQDSVSDHQDLISDSRPADEEENEEDKDAEDAPQELAEKRTNDVSLDRDLEEYLESMKPEERKAEEIYKDSLNVTPEVVDVPPRPDSLEPDEDEREKLRDEDINGNATRNNKFDDLKDRLIEIEMAERSIEKALVGQQTATCNDEAMSEVGRSASVEKMDEARKSSDEEVTSEIGKSANERGTTNEERKSVNQEEEEEESINEAQRRSNNVEKSTNGEGIPNEEVKSTNEGKEKEKPTNEAEERSNNIEKSTNEREISNEEKKSLNEKEESTNKAKPFEKMIEEKESKAQVGVSTNEAGKVPNGVEDLMVKRHIENLESTNTRYKIKNDQIVEASVRGTGDKDDGTSTNGKTVTDSTSSQTTDSRNTADEHSKANLPTNGKDTGKTKARKRRDTNEVAATSLSLKIPFSYVLSEGSPCEIPDSVTTVIIPDRPCPSPVMPEIEDHQPGSTYLPIESTAHDNIVEDVSLKNETRQDENRGEYGMEAFGEYIRPEVTVLPVVHGVKGVKSGQDIVIVHQDLDRIKEEGEEEEEDKEDDEREKKESHLEKKDDGQTLETTVGQAEKTTKLENIAEHEESKTKTKTTAEEIHSSRVPVSEALPETIQSDLTNAGKTDVAGESRSMLDNSSEENGSSQDIHTTTTSSEAKESTASNQSIESSSVGRPIVPELNLDSLQDNTVSSFKMTANGTATKESNGSPRESDATMSLVEPLTPDERLIGNRLVLADRELESPIEELVLSSPNRLQSDAPEADQLYPAEHAEYELLGKDPLSSEAVLEDEAKAQEEALSHDVARVDSISQEKKKSEELDSEEEIARELIGLLDNEAQLRTGGSSRRKRSLSDSVHSVSVNEAEQEKGGVPSERFGKLDDEGVSRTEAVSELSGHIEDSNQETEGKVTANKETKDSRLEVEKKEHVESSLVASIIGSEQGAEESSAKDNATTETEKPKVEHIENSQVVSLEESKRDESSVKDETTTNEEIEEPKVEIVKKKHIESSQITPLAGSRQDEPSAKDSVTINEKTEEPKVEVEEKKHIKTSQVAPLVESERDEFSIKDKAIAKGGIEESKVEVEEKKLETSQVASLAESKQNESLAKDKATTKEEIEESKVEVEEKKHIETSQVTSLTGSEQDESLVKDKVKTNGKIEESKVEVEEKKHVETSQVAPLVEFERDESSAKDKTTTDKETEEPKVEVEEKKHIETSQVASLAESERDESSAKDKTTTDEETKEPKVEVEEKKHIKTSQVAPLVESERDESSAKDKTTTDVETEEPKVKVEEKKHTETSQVAPLAEFDRDELLEENGSHEMPDGKIAAENERGAFTSDQKSPKDKQVDVEVLKSQSSESASKIEEFHENQKDKEREDQGKSEGGDVKVQEECQEKELNDEEKRERKESTAHEEDKQEHMEVQEATKLKEVQEVMKSREVHEATKSPNKSIEENKDVGHDETVLTESIPESSVDDQTARDATSGKEEKTDDLSAKLESVHGPIISAISQQSTQDYHRARYWTMGTKSSTAETVIEAFGSNASADEKTESLDDTPKIENESVARKKDDFHSAVVKIQACTRGFLARRRLQKDSIPKDVPLAQKTAVVNNEHLLVPEDRSNLRETRSGRHRLRREEALRKTTLSLENAFATSRLQHTGEFHDTVPLPLFDMTHSRTNSDSLDESMDKEDEEELTKTDTAKSSTCETDSNCHDDERRRSSQKSNTFADHSDLPIVMQLLADASRNCHFRINRNSDVNLNAAGAKLVEPTLDILMLGYPRDDATLQNGYLNFITSVEDISSNMDYSPPDVAKKSATNANDAQPSVISGETSLREPLAIPGTPQGVIIEELTSLDETGGDVSSTKASTATKTSLDTNSSVPLEECALEDKKNSESSPKANLIDKDNTISDQKNTMEGVGEESGDTSAVDRNSQSVGEDNLRAQDASEKSNATFNSNGHAGEEENRKT